MTYADRNRKPSTFLRRDIAMKSRAVARSFAMYHAQFIILDCAEFTS